METTLTALTRKEPALDKALMVHQGKEIHTLPRWHTAPLFTHLSVLIKTLS